MGHVSEGLCEGLAREMEANPDQFPSWVQNNIDWYKQDLITCDAFFSGVSYLSNAGIINEPDINQESIQVNAQLIALGINDTARSAEIADKQRQLAKPDLLTVGEIVHVIDFFTSDEARNITDQRLYFGGPR